MKYRATSCSCFFLYFLNRKCGQGDGVVLSLCLVAGHGTFVCFPAITLRPGLPSGLRCSGSLSVCSIWVPRGGWSVIRVLVTQTIGYTLFNLQKCLFLTTKIFVMKFPHTFQSGILADFSEFNFHALFNNCLDNQILSQFWGFCCRQCLRLFMKKRGMGVVSLEMNDLVWPCIIAKIFLSDKRVFLHMKFSDKFSAYFLTVFLVYFLRIIKKKSMINCRINFLLIFLIFFVVFFTNYLIVFCIINCKIHFQLIFLTFFLVYFLRIIWQFFRW